MAWGYLLLAEHGYARRVFVQSAPRETGDGRPGRAVRLSVSESESVALSMEEAERFLRRAQRFRERAVA